MKLKTILITLLGLFLLPGLLIADTLKMKNGTIIRGKVTRFGNGEFTILMEGSTARSSSRAIVNVNDIESIEFDTPTTPATSTGADVPQAINSTGTRPVGTSTNPPPNTTTTSPTNVSRPPVTQPSPTTGTSTTPPRSAVPNIRSVAVNVPAREDWTSTGIIVTKGQRIRVSATGQVDLGNGRKSGPEGIALDDRDRLMTNWPTGGLIAVIGDDNDDFIYIGRSHEFTAQRNGRLFLSVNEGNLKDNLGSFAARVEVESSSVSGTRE